MPPDPEAIRRELAQFTGSSQFFIHPSTGVVYTEGAKYVAEACKAYWLLDVIASHLVAGSQRVQLRKLGIVFWTLSVDEHRQAILNARPDSDEPAIVTQYFPYTDFPLDKLDIWTQWGTTGKGSTGWTIFLPSEY